MYIRMRVLQVTFVRWGSDQFSSFGEPVILLAIERSGKWKKVR
jgi:hypothetical protein